MNIKHDRLLDVALGNNRKTKIWKNRQMAWSEILDRLSQFTRTPETMAEYRAMGRAKQADIKDVGGFVGGYCTNGSRSDIAHRSILCLDADFADGDLWDDYCMICGNAAAIYSTHKHTTEKPRLRLVVPLSRDVSPDEYQAIGRRVAYLLGIDKFDDTSYEPQRLMYWPSVSQDGPTVFEFCDGPLLDPDTILTDYVDWHDVSSWPMSSRQAELPKKSGAKQGDPLEKKGLVGAFCRAYFPISEAIEAYVPDYAPCGDGRYTYTGGSTAGGVIIYDDRFSYSHHGTDPASGMTCNAWDLVRVHRFHHLDADADPTTPISGRPSYKAMAELAAADERVRVQVINDRLTGADEAFAEQVPDAPAGDAWKGQIKTTDKGAVAQTIENVVIILRNDPRLAGALALNEMSHDITARKSLPWRSVTAPSQWTDQDDAALRYYLEHTYGISSKDRVFDAVNVVAAENKYHPVREYLSGCQWDGVPRLDTLLIDYLGAEDTPYVRAVTRKTLTAAVARVFSPGCKFDYMLTLRGRQGVGKSTLISKLGGEWFSDTFSTVQGKESYEQVQGVWLMEVGELAGMKKADAETIKLFISKKSDRFRPAYGRRMTEFPRQCIFVGSTNETQFLRDTTGNRRFWVVDTSNDARLSPWEDLTPATVQSIWAEAVDAYKAGEELFLPKELEAVAREIQAAYEEENPRAGIVSGYLERLLPEDWEHMDLYQRRQWLESGEEGTVPRESVCTLEIWAEALGGNPDKLDRYASKDIRDIMAGFPDWRHQGNQKISTGPYGRQRYYRRKA